MTFNTIETEVRNGVGIVWLNRPEVRNAFNDDMIVELTHAFVAMDKDPAVRAMVLAAHGKAFCAGADLNWMKRMSGFSYKENYADAMHLANMLRTLHSLAKPTIARVHGPAYAGGMGLLSACDIAVATIGAEFCLSEVKLGLVPATISPYVIAAMGERMARRYFLSAEVFTAAEAYRIGLVQELVADDEIDTRINALLGHILQGAPGAHAASKDLIKAVARAPLAPDLIADTANRIARARASEEGREGVRAFLEKGRPSWQVQKKSAAATRVRKVAARSSKGAKK
ncbi:MAG: enoyl-CoA hydratase/isomerase family protein [Betaproteobacteria bacterium]|nr:enoyl-CoA hydratase/isomerase family protein [Betaproteobacteria bacterium]